jgi:hypothetical protein
MAAGAERTPIPIRAAAPQRPPVQKRTEKSEANGNSEITGPMQRILNAMAWFESIGNMQPKLAAIAFLAGYTIGGGAFNNPRGALRTLGLVEYRGDSMALTDEGRALAEAPAEALTQEELHSKVLGLLPGPEQKLLQPLLEVYPEEMTNEELADKAGYTAGAGAFNNPRGRLRTLGLIDYSGKGSSKAASLLFF